MNALIPTSLILVGNLPEKTQLTFANSIKGASLQFGNTHEIRRVVVLETEASMQCTDERNQVIRSLLGPLTTIISVPCIDDFRMRAFQTIADELRRRDIVELIVDITNGRRNQTFDLIIATSICRIENVIMTTVPRECYSTPYDELDQDKYSVTTIRPFSQDPSLEAAAQFELIYYTDRIHRIIEEIKTSGSESMSGYVDTIEKNLTNAVMNYFSEDSENLVNALKRLAELHEGIVRRLGQQISGNTKGEANLWNIIESIRKELSEPARVSAAQEDEVDQDRLAAVMLSELFDFCRKYRNYVSHPYHRRVSRTEVRLMIFVTFAVLEQASAVTAWLERNPQCT